MNVGAVKIPDSGRKRGYRFVRFAFPGCSDLIGQTAQGRFLAVEIKRPGEHPTAEQRAFLATVAQSGGVSGVARSIEDCRRLLDAA